MRGAEGLRFCWPALALPFATWVMLGYYRSIPEDLEDAAMIDGANRLGAFWRITLPLAAPALLGAPGVAAQGVLPARGLRIVIGYPVGGGADEMAHVIASALQRRLSRPVVIENRPGAAGAAVGEILKKAPTDGSVLGFIPTATLIGRLTTRSFPFDPQTDILPLTLAGTYAWMGDVDTLMKGWWPLLAGAAAAVTFEISGSAGDADAFTLTYQANGIAPAVEATEYDVPVAILRHEIVAGTEHAHGKRERQLRPALVERPVHVFEALQVFSGECKPVMLDQPLFGGVKIVPEPLVAGFRLAEALE